MSVPSPGRDTGSPSGGATGSGRGGGSVEETSGVDHDTETGLIRGAALLGADDMATAKAPEPTPETTGLRSSRTMARTTPTRSSSDRSATRGPGVTWGAKTPAVSLGTGVAGRRTGGAGVGATSRDGGLARRVVYGPGREEEVSLTERPLPRRPPRAIGTSKRGSQAGCKQIQIGEGRFCCYNTRGNSYAESAHYEWSNRGGVSTCSLTSFISSDINVY